jgi:hypothetical protein
VTVPDHVVGHTPEQQRMPSTPVGADRDHINLLLLRVAHNFHKRHAPFHSELHVQTRAFVRRQQLSKLDPRVFFRRPVDDGSFVELPDKRLGAGDSLEDVEHMKRRAERLCQLNAVRQRPIRFGAEVGRHQHTVDGDRPAHAARTSAASCRRRWVSANIAIPKNTA